MPSVLHPWVENLSFRMQGALLSAIRGCDNVPKEDPSKALQRVLRPMILKSACEHPSSFIDLVEEIEVKKRQQAFLDNFDHYPVHFVLHLMHAAQIIGCYYPSSRGEHWARFYAVLCHKMHVQPENPEQFERRLS